MVNKLDATVRSISSKVTDRLLEMEPEKYTGSKNICIFPLPLSTNLDGSVAIVAEQQDLRRSKNYLPKNPNF